MVEENKSHGFSDVRFDRVRLVVRRCWRRLGRKHVMVIWPQAVPWFGHRQYDDRGRAECTGCGRTHVILGSDGFVAGTD